MPANKWKKARRPSSPTDGFHACFFLSLSSSGHLSIHHTTSARSCPPPTRPVLMMPPSSTWFGCCRGWTRGAFCLGFFSLVHSSCCCFPFHLLTTKRSPHPTPHTLHTPHTAQHVSRQALLGAGHGALHGPRGPWRYVLCVQNPSPPLPPSASPPSVCLAPSCARVHDS